jgi:hypothetical protein
LRCKANHAPQHARRRMTSKTRLFKELKEARAPRAAKRAEAPHLRSARALTDGDCVVVSRRAQLQADTRETEIELVADDNNIYRWVGYLKACASVWSAAWLR